VTRSFNTTTSMGRLTLNILLSFAQFEREVIGERTPRQRQVDRWFYIDIRKTMDPSVDREDAIIAVPADRRLTTDFGRTVLLDLSTPAHEYEHTMFPTNQVFDWDAWQAGGLQSGVRGYRPERCSMRGEL
jgi:hypothetical protein